MGQQYWPSGVDREPTLDSYTNAFRVLGYEACADGAPEKGYEKVAIFTDAQGVPTHAARHLSGAYWTSKLGISVDISHSLAGMDGGAYGQVVRFLKRLRKRRS